MSIPINLLIVEDSQIDEDMLVRELRRAGFDPKWQRVQTEPDFLAELKKLPDIILSDYSMPEFSGIRAAVLLKESGLDIPFILVSGTVGEDVAVEAMKHGAADFLLKDRIGRLGMAVERGLELKRLRDKHKHAEEARRMSEARYGTLFECAPDGIVVADGNGFYLDANGSMCRMLGYGLDELIKLHSSDIVTEAEIPQIQVALQEIHWERDYHREWQFRRKDGSNFDAEVIATKMPDGNVLALVRDITERKRFQQALQQTNVELESARSAAERASQAKSDFLSSMSHELRTPLNGIIGFTEFLYDEKPGPLLPKQKEYLGDVLNSGHHLLQLINDVLDLAKVEAGKMEFRPETFTVRKTIEETISVINGMARKRHIAVGIEIIAPLDVVTLDQAKFKQVLYNLVSNAVKFTHEGGKAIIQARHLSPREIEVQVQDNGIGIKAENLSRLFSEFDQLDSGTSRHFEGTGLGLALTKKIVELQGGSITVESKPGQGSVFTVVLPMQVQEREAA